MSHNIFDNPDQLLEYYKIQADDFRMRPTAIWTEIQHYTWVLSVLLGAGPLTAVNQTGLSRVQLGFLLFLPALGFMISLVAFLIIRKDFVYYNQADARLLYIEKQLGASDRPAYLDDRLRKASKAGFNVSQYISEQNRLGLNSIVALRIRSLILGSFLLYSIAALAEFAYFYNLLLQ
jgi:hypothetical protein